MERCCVLLLLALLTARVSENAAGVNLSSDEASTKGGEFSETSAASEASSLVDDSVTENSDDKSDLSDSHKTVTFSEEAYVSSLDSDVKNRSIRRLSDENQANKVLGQKDAGTQTDIEVDEMLSKNTHIGSTNSDHVTTTESLVPVIEVLNGNRDVIHKSDEGAVALIDTDKELPEEAKTDSTPVLIALEESPQPTNATGTDSTPAAIDKDDEVPVAPEESGSRCPARCVCGVTSQELRCSARAPPREPARLVITGERHYVNIECREARVLECSEVPPYDMCGGRDVTSVGLTRCGARAALRCVRARLRVGRVHTLTYKDVPPGTVMERGDFEGVPGLDRVIVRCSSSDNVSISGLALTAVPSLRRLVLSGVRLPPSAPFLPPALVLLELNAARLARVTSQLLRGLRSLEKLMLFNNVIESIDDDAFDDTPSVWQVDVSANRLVSLPRALVSHPALRSLSLSRNPLRLLPPLTPLQHLVNLTASMGLVELALSPGALAGLPALANVDLRFNRISVLPPDTFHGSAALVNLDLSHNAIYEMPVELLRDQTALQRLDVSHNKLRSLDARQFETLSALKVLKLDYNMLKELPNRLLSGARSLIQLSLSHNSLLSLRRGALAGATELQDIDLSYNNLTYDPYSTESSYHPLDAISPFNGLTNLRKITLAHNSVKASFHDVAISLPRLNYYDLSYNDIKEIGGMDELNFVSDNVTVDMRHNAISHVSLRPFAMISDFPDPRQSYILLDDNPLTCDCNLFELARRLQGFRPNPDFAPSEPRFDIGDARCESPSDLKGRLFRSVRINELICQVEPWFCPEACICVRRPATNSWELTCKAPPSKFPVKLSNEVVKVKLTQLPASFAEMSPFVYELDLSGLGLQAVPSDIPAVKLLNLTNNELTRPPVELFERENLTLLLAGNKFSCGCSDAWYVKEMQDQWRKIGDYWNITCAEGEALSGVAAARACDGVKAGAAGGALAAVGLAVALGAALLYRHSTTVKVFLFKYGVCIFDEDDVDDDKEYDAFLSFSHADEKLVIEELLPGLESGPKPFRICVHYRDWIPGEWIPAQIARSVEQSRRTIVVLSKNFLNSVWGRLEFRTAHMSAVRESRSRVIVILLEDVTGHGELDAELRAYLATNTYLRWGDPAFWDRLRFALPRRRGEARARGAGRAALRALQAAGGEKPPPGGIDACLTPDGKILNIAAIKAAPV